MIKKLMYGRNTEKTNRLVCIGDAARQKEKANSSVSELLLAVRRPRALSESGGRPLIRKSASGDDDQDKPEKSSRRKSESVASFRRKSHAGDRTSMEKITEIPENKHKTSRRRSFMGYICMLVYLSCL